MCLVAVAGINGADSVEMWHVATLPKKTVPFRQCTSAVLKQRQTRRTLLVYICVAARWCLLEVK